MSEITKFYDTEFETTDLTPIEIALGVDEEGRTTAKKLYKFLGLAQSHYARWIKTNIIKNEFAEKDVDFIPFAINGEDGGAKTYDYKLSATFAKKLAMGTHNERGDEAQRYFIKIEEAARQKSIDYSRLSPETVMMLKLGNAIAKNEIEQKKLKIELDETKEDVQNIRDVITINPKAEWRKQCNRVLNLMAKDKGNYEDIRNEAYEALSARAKCRPKILINNLKERAKKNGVAQSKIDKLNILDVLENDSRLREIYIYIVKQMAIKYKVKFKEEVD